MSSLSSIILSQYVVFIIILLCLDFNLYISRIQIVRILFLKINILKILNYKPHDTNGFYVAPSSTDITYIYMIQGVSACSALNIGGKSWKLPTLSQGNLIYLNKNKLNSLNSGYLWRYTSEILGHDSDCGCNNTNNYSLINGSTLVVLTILGEIDYVLQTRLILISFEI